MLPKRDENAYALRRHRQSACALGGPGYGMRGREREAWSVVLQELDQSTQRSTVIADNTEAALNLIQSSLGARPKVDGLGPVLDP